MSKRPWERYAKVNRIELNNGDVVYSVDPNLASRTRDPKEFNMPTANYQTLDEATGALDAWWADWWPRQIKSSRKA